MTTSDRRHQALGTFLNHSTRLFSVAVVLTALTLSACSGPTDEPSAGPSVSEDEQAKVDSAAEIKKILEGIAASGEGGSSLVGLRPSIEGLDAPNKDALLADLTKLEAAASPEQIKQIAKSMAAKL